MRLFEALTSAISGVSRGWGRFSSTLRGMGGLWAEELNGSVGNVRLVRVAPAGGRCPRQGTILPL